jgi:hypothetical protein
MASPEQLRAYATHLSSLAIQAENDVIDPEQT